MGCSSEMGCLGPKPRQREVYVDLIETMHSEVAKMTISNNGQAYREIRDRLLKKGLLRKLIDNLVSHKAHIYDCLNQNFEVISQTSLGISRIAGLVITDKIMEELRKQHRSSDNIDEYLSKNKSFHQISQNYRQLNEASMGVNESSTPLGLELDHRLDLLYFRFMLFLLENEESIYNEVLQSINKFVSHRKEKLSCKAQIFKIFDMLINMMKRGKAMEESSTTFAIILQKLKQNLKQESTDSDNITFILKAIVSHGDKSSKITDVTLDNFKDIIGTYFSRYFGEFDVLFTSLLKIFDDLSFQATSVSKIEEIVLTITKSQDIYLPFMRGLFVQLQAYLLQVDNRELVETQKMKESHYEKTQFKNIHSEISKINAFRLLSRWVVNGNIEANQTIAYNSSALVSPYVINILNSNSQGFIFQVKRQFSKVISTLSSKSSHIIIDYLVEEIKDMHISDKIRRVMLNLIKEVLKIKGHSTPEDSLNHLSTIFPVEKYFGLQIKIQILEIAKILFKDIKYEYISRNTQANQTLKTKICAFFYSLHQNMIDSQNSSKEDCEFLGMTASRKFINSEQSQRQRYFILAKTKLFTQIFQFLKCLINQHLHILVLPYLESINDCLLHLDSNWKRDEDIIITFFLLNLLYRGLMEMNKSERVPQQLMKINLKLQDSMINLTIKQEMISWVQKTLSLPAPTKQLGQFEGLKTNNPLDPMISSLVQANRKKIDSTREFSMLSPQQYTQMIEFFKEFFRSNPLSTGRNEGQSSRTDMKLFNRSSSVNVTLDEIYSQRNSARMQGEESFRDILERIQEV